MSIALISEILRNTLWTTLLVSAPFLGIALLSGLILSIFQATTSLQDQSLTFAPKIILILLSFGLLGGWVFAQLQQFSLRLFSMIVSVASSI